MGHLVRLSYPEAPSGSWSATTHADSTVPATTFSDFDCTVVKTSRTLNASGRDTFYVNAMIDVIVSNAAGLAVDAFTEGTRSEMVGVNSLYWTGTKSDGSQGLGGTTDLPSVISALAASAGAPNGYVLETGQTTPLLIKDALANVRTQNFPYFNVKSSPYNAVGDGVANDSAAIQAAINACASAGGGVVFFPRGTYFIPTGLSITNAKVCLSGDGPTTSVLSYTSAAGYAITVNCASAAYSGNYISDLGITSVSTGGVLQVVATVGFQLTRCRLFGALNSPGSIAISSRCYVTNNVIDIQCSTALRGVVELTNVSGLVGSQFALNTFDNSSGATDASVAAISGGTTANSVPIVFTGNAFNSPTGLSLQTLASYAFSGNSVAGFKLVDVRTGGQASDITESATALLNTVGSGIISSSIGATYLAGFIRSSSRNVSFTHASGTTFSPYTDVEDQVIDVTGTPVTANAPATYGPRWDGCPITFRIRNTTGAPAVINWNAAYLGSAAMGNLAAGATRVVTWRFKGSGTTPGWRYCIHADTT